MCYAIPGKVIEFENNIAVIDYFGEKKKARNEFFNLKRGDYIYAQGGYVIEVLPEEEARSILNFWRETFFELQEKDLRLSKVDFDEKETSKNFRIILDKVLEEKPLKKEDLLTLLKTKNKNELSLIFRVANFLRHKHHGNSCCVHGIIEISNYCNQSCLYCGISKSNKKLPRYRMTEKEIIETAVLAVSKYGFKSLVLQGGEDTGLSLEKLAEIISEIKKKVAVLIFVSFGEIGFEGLKILFEAGARGLLLRFETSNQKIYQKLRPGCSLDKRLAHLHFAKELGYLIATGFLIGLPGQSDEDILSDIFLTKKLEPEMYSIGPFLPHGDTPLAKSSKPQVDYVLKTIALCRIIDPKNSRPVVSTSFETLYPLAVREGLLSGASSLMLILTPQKYKVNYNIYPDRAHQKESIKEQIEKTILTLKDLGRSPIDFGTNT